MNITIQELLSNRGLNISRDKIKLVRHKDTSKNAIDLYNLYRSDKSKFLEYQRTQSKDVFKGVDFIVSFIGEEGTLARFVGVFKILSGTRLPEKRKSIDGSFHQYEYEIEEVSGFEELRERVIIEWGKSTLSWHQWIKDDKKKEVVQIHPGFNYKHFTDYFDFILDFHELKEIITKQYKDWKQMLAATKGIYLISDSKTGKLYVGSAYGEEGIWGRWSTYVRTNGHGENKTLKELIDQDNNYASNFRFSILMLLPMTFTQPQAIKKEKIFKDKLGTNSFGLNLN